MYNGNPKITLIRQSEKIDLVYHEYYEQYQILFKDGWEIVTINNNQESDALEISLKIFKLLNEEVDNMKQELCEVRNNFDICHRCGFCEKGDDSMDIVEEISEIIGKFLNVEQIDTPELGDIMEFNLYDFNNKEVDFKQDIKAIVEEIAQNVPSHYLILHQYYNDEFWNGEEMVESNLSCKLTIDATYKDMEIVADNFLGTEEELKSIAKNIYECVDATNKDDSTFMDECESMMTCDYPYLKEYQEDEILKIIDELICKNIKIGEL